MTHFRSASLLFAATIGSSTAAFAGAGIINTAVVPITTNITYSKAATPSRPALTTYIGYQVDIANGGGNTVNNIVFTATTTVTNAGESAEFVPSATEGATCAAAANPPGKPANARSISCTIGQLPAGQAAPTFFVFFTAPMQAGTTNPDVVAFRGITYYAEGTGGLGNSIPQNSTRAWAASDVALGTPNPTLVKSVVTKGGGTLLTGDSGVSNSFSPFTTTAVVPASTSYTTADITVAELLADPNCTNFIPCYSTVITIPGTFSPYLTFVLRVDSSKIRRGTNINGVVLYYQPDPEVQAFEAIGDCGSATSPQPGGVPCIAARKYYKNKSTPGWTTELDGDFEWRILNTKNGGYKIN